MAKRKLESLSVCKISNGFLVKPTYSESKDDEIDGVMSGTYYGGERSWVYANGVEVATDVVGDMLDEA